MQGAKELAKYFRYKVLVIMRYFFRNFYITGCKENHFYSLQFGQAEASIY